VADKQKVGYIWANGGKSPTELYGKFGIHDVPSLRRYALDKYIIQIRKPKNL